jgi:anti-sigma regulatory factor (Ser/Thr protein kinase)
VGRRHLREQCALWRLAHGVETAELLTGELLANAIVHAGTPMELCVELRPGVLHVSVGDEDARRPVPFDAGPATTGGRGLTLVQALAERWGVERDGHDPGKRVWFEVPVG